MPRYYFDLVDDQTVLDHKGIVLNDVKEARRFAADLARELAETKPEYLGESNFAWWVQVSDSNFGRLFAIPLSQACEPDPGPKK